MPNYLSRKDILEKIPQLKFGSFDYWVRYKAGIEPHDNVQKGHLIMNIYPLDCIDKIKKVMGVK